MVSLALTLIAAQAGPEFSGDKPGAIYDASRASKPSIIDKRLTCGLIEVADAMVPLFAASPKSSEAKHYLPMFASKSTGKSLIALPYATDERFRNVTLNIAGKQYPLRLPVSTSFGSYKRKPVSARLGHFKVEAMFEPWRYTSENFIVKFSITPKSRSPRLVSYSVQPLTIGGVPPAYETELQEFASPMMVIVDRTSPYDHLSVKATELTAHKIQLKVKKPRGGKPEYYALDGTKVYSSNNRLTGYAALKVRNIYLINAAQSESDHQGMRPAMPC